MSDISKINPNGTEYNLKDATARTNIGNLSNLNTTEKTDLVSAINEVKSGLINYQTQNDLNLEVPNRKNILPMTVSGIKSANRSGTWNGNTYTLSTITMTIDTDSNGNVESITLNGTGNNNIYLAVSDKFTANTNADVVLSGANIGVNSLYMSDETIPTDITTAEFTTTAGHEYVAVYHATESNYDNFKLYPMIRPATITDPTFVPYIPSVESRIEAVESGLIDVNGNLTNVQTQISGLHSINKGTAASSADAVFTCTAPRYVGLLMIYQVNGYNAIYAIQFYNSTFIKQKLSGSDLIINEDTTTGSFTVPLGAWGTALFITPSPYIS